MRVQMILQSVKSGMSVFDISGLEMGHVTRVYFGEDNVSIRIPDEDVLIQRINDALGGNVQLPSIAYKYLYTSGFVRVDRGLLRHDLIVTPQDIKTVDSDGVWINTETARLIHI